MTMPATTQPASQAYPLASPSWDDAEIQAMHRVIDSGMFTMGKEVRAFEEQFAHFVGSRYAVMVNSGSSANLLMMAALRYRRDGVSLKHGDEVIVPAVSWSTTYYPLYQHGLKVRFVDIDPLTLNLDPEGVRQAITPATKAVLAVNLLGNPNDFDALQSICNEHGLLLLEDNCESLGAIFNGKQAGTFGLMGTYSSFFSHHISTMEGGLIVTNDEELYHILLSIRSHGWTRHLPSPNRVCGEKSDNAFDEAFHFILPGYNVRPLELEGAIGQEQLQKLPDFIARRRENATCFEAHFKDHPTFQMQKELGESSWFGFALIIRSEKRDEINRADVVRSLMENGIEVRPIVTGNFAKNPVCEYFDSSISGDLKHAEEIDRYGFFAGNHHFDIKAQILYLEGLLAPFA